ncbi:MAG: hypothetical protein HPY59_13860 [Anaerolineae bacterium]|jgi:hypothetical protein|nr:hypothetical protein [Anaerolineae bacterium]BCY16558.1 hypothetical protein hrd7_04070 [Leptolinea sp. HRD-7]
MDQLPTLQQLEYLESGFEVSKILAHAGFSMEKPAFSITWGQIAEEIAHTLADHGLPPDRFEEDFLIDLVQGIQKVLQNDDVLFWRNCIRAYTSDQPILRALMNSQNEDDDEGSLTEQYENAIRLGDDEAYWPDGGASADLFDEF